MTRRGWLRGVALACAARGHAAAAGAPARASQPVPAGAATADLSARRGVSQVLQVGPRRTLTTLAAAARQARDGDTVEVDAGDYVGDVAVWSQRDLTLRAAGGRARLLAQGADAEGKGIWVMRGGRFSVDGFDFVGAAVPSGNGAGIRFEQGALRVRDCRFFDNENGILTGNDPALELEIESSEFGRNGRGDGQSHNLYVGAIAHLSVVGSYFHHARVGHLLKSRAATNRITYNRLTDEDGGSASYELEFPNGGVAVVVGNLIEQGAQTGNPVMVSFGIEGYKHPANELYMVNNTLVDHRAQGGVFVRVAPGAGVQVKLVDNLLVGRGDLAAAGAGEFAANQTMAVADFDRAVDADFQWRTLPAGGLQRAVEPGAARGVSLRPTAQYRHPLQVAPLGGGERYVGAVQPVAGR